MEGGREGGKGKRERTALTEKERESTHARKAWLLRV
jgi:hypothetical protein